ncbi:hypothetical protein KO465_06285 [Candidatus Micrarchaeota archaeon]|nr:hypothetical protein [Candidatus Micrarchaeota archaeon]
MYGQTVKAFTVKKYGDMYRFCVYNPIEKYIPSEVDNLYLQEINFRPWEGVSFADDEYFEIKKNIKLECNLVRAKSRVIELGLCNDWDWFGTFTIDKKKYDRYDLKNYYKAFSNFIRNYRTRSGKDIKYLIIPEMHQDGAWHAHGLIKGLAIGEDLKSDGLPCKLQKMGFYNWLPYMARFGWCSFSPIKLKERVAFYITKYLYKGMAERINDYDGHLFYASKGLNSAEVLQRGELYQGDLRGYPMISNDWCSWVTMDRQDFENDIFLQKILNQ